MDKLTKKEFQSLSLNKRFQLLKKHGEHIAVRQKSVHLIHLFSIYNFYVEVWILLSFNHIQWIEIQDNKTIINGYADNINIKKHLDI
ncbi:MAG: hypothetical protein COA32_06730 [Fluviicola sp.]|nr:MAG: hypothetical protein COA32_06730 [Fluviicola sp.]